MYTIKMARKEAVEKLLTSIFLTMQPYSVHDAFLDTDVLLSFAVKKNRAWLISHIDYDLGELKTEFCKLVELRCSGLAIAYIIGEKEFWGLPFFINRAVLPPKPDSELLVEKASRYMKRHISKNFSFLDVCTGSGCIGISILSTCGAGADKRLNGSPFFKDVRCVFADISPEALDAARKNAVRLLSPDVQHNLVFELCDIRIGLPKADNSLYDMITANPPYIPTKKTEQLLKDGRGEPALALDGGEDGLTLIKSLAEKSSTVLKKGGVIFCETGEYNAVGAAALFEKNGFEVTDIHKDISNQDRLVEAHFIN